MAPRTMEITEYKKQLQERTNGIYQSTFLLCGCRELHCEFENRETHI